MKKLTFLATAALFMALASCSNSFKVSGELEGEDTYVLFANNVLDTIEVVPDTIPVADHKFVFEGQTAGDPVLAVVASELGMQSYFITEPGEITIDKEGMATGTPLNDALTGFLRALSDESNATEEGIDSIVNATVTAHNNDIVGAFALALAGNYIGLAKMEDLLNQCGSKVKDTIYKLISPEQFEDARKAKEASESTAEGKMFTDFEAEYEGKVQHLSDYVGKGKYVLVDFWASWCGPCRGEIPTIISLYDKYAGENFEVLGVATWDEPENTLAAMEELGIKYPQIMNAQKAGSDAYGINGIPEIILFAPDGTIAKRGLRGEAMVEAVKEALGVEE